MGHPLLAVGDSLAKVLRVAALHQLGEVSSQAFQCLRPHSCGVQTVRVAVGTDFAEARLPALQALALKPVQREETPV